MGLTVKNSSGDFALAPAGVHVARCYMMIDIGTQSDTWKGQPKVNRKIRIGWELPEETHIFKPENGPEPFTLSKKYTALLGDKSNLRKDLQSWRGREFTPEELQGFDLQKIVGVYCQLQIIHVQSKTDPTKIHANVGAIMGLPPKTPKPPAVNEPLIYNIEDGTGGSFNRIPEWIRKEIQMAQEFSITTDPNHQADASQTTETDGDDNCPF